MIDQSIFLYICYHAFLSTIFLSSHIGSSMGMVSGVHDSLSGKWKPVCITGNMRDRAQAAMADIAVKLQMG